MSTELLDNLHAKGLSAALVHFESLIQCMRSVLPEAVQDTIPKTLDEVAGLFSASTKEFYLVILHETPGYESMNAVFEYAQIKPVGVVARGIDPMGWSLKKFCVMIGGNGMFALPKEYTATCIEDALVLSTQIAKYREKYAAENIPMPEMASSLPN